MGCVALQLTGINAVMFYSGKFFDAAHYEHKVLGSVLVMAWNFVATIFAIGLVDRFGRRGLMNLGLLLIAVSITLLTPMDEWVHDDSVKAVLCFMGPGCLFWVYLPEVAPEGCPLLPVANGLQWLFTLLVTFAFPGMQNAMQGYTSGARNQRAAKAMLAGDGPWSAAAAAAEAEAEAAAAVKGHTDA
eukprot:gene52942-38916_t